MGWKLDVMGRVLIDGKASTFKPGQVQLQTQERVRE